MTPCIIDLQYFQELHDRRYHVDIYSKPLAARLAHLHQHLVKYSSTAVKRNQTYPDAIATILSMANALNINISRQYGINEQDYRTLADFGQIYHEDQMEEQYRKALAKLAKALEAYDHMEAHDYRINAGSSLLELLSVLMQLSKFKDGIKGQEMTVNYILKISDIKQRHIFYPHYHVEDMANHSIYKSMYVYVGRL